MARTNYTMKVEFSLEGWTDAVRVYTDGSYMGSFETFAEAGQALGEEFEYRMKRQPDAIDHKIADAWNRAVDKMEG